MKIFTCTAVKKQGRNWHVLVPGGGKNWNFWPKYLPLCSLLLLALFPSPIWGSSGFSWVTSPHTIMGNKSVFARSFFDSDGKCYPWVFIVAKALESRDGATISKVGGG